MIAHKMPVSGVVVWLLIHYISAVVEKMLEGAFGHVEIFYYRFEKRDFYPGKNFI
ncbi:MAG: hypothetical protein ACOC11_01780 [Prolixibacteraceae bacterium]